MVYEKILLLLILILFIIAIYYISKTCYKHNSILEKFSEKQIYKNAKFRDCQVYFTNNKEKCDEDYKLNSNNMCKYKFEGWKEIAEITDSNDNVYNYADKVYVDNKLNENDYQNILEETRCFYKLGDEDDKSGNNITTIDKISYKYQDFYPFSMENSICSINYPTKTELKGKQFYEFLLDNNNYIKEIKKVDILPGQNGFKVDDSFSIKKFVEKYGNGLEYKSKNEFNIYQVSRFPDINVKVHKFTYNYLCYNTQVMNYNIITTKINIGNIIDLPNNSVIVRTTNNGNAIDTDIPGIDWNKFKNSNPNFREDKRQAIIDELVARKEVLQDQLKNKNKETAIKLEKIKENIADDGIDSKYQLTKYINTNSGKWNQDKFLKQFNVFNYKRHYLIKSADATIDTTIADVTIRIKNNFKEGLKWFKVDGYYHDNIEYIINKEQNYSIQQESGSNVTKFKGLRQLTNGKLYANHDNTYTMWFTGYFYAHEAGNYIFGTSSDDASFVYLNDKLIVNNGGLHGMRESVSGNNYLNKKEIYKLDIYFGENSGGDNLEFFWKKDVQVGGQKIYTTDLNGKTWIYHTVPAFPWSPFTEGELAKPSNDIPLIGNTQYVDCIYSDLNNKILSDSSGDIYYEFKNTDFIYDIKVNRNIKTSILVVGGGGGGGAFGGGGGGGTVLFSESKELARNDLCIIKVGNGGNGATVYNNGINGKNGIDSSITINGKSYVAKGGGGGGTRNPQAIGVNGNDGGSGGGGSHSNVSGKQAMGGVSNKVSYDGWKSYGNNGGKGRNGIGGGEPDHASGGGGGAGFRGEDAIQTTQQYRNFTSSGGGGDGGVGINLISYFGSNVGENGFFGGGGGGSTYWKNGRVGWGSSYTGISDDKREYGGGGDGGYRFGHGKPGMKATGGGGGGGGAHSDRSGRGGSGVVILRINSTPSTKLAKCNYYIPPLSEITSYLEKSDVLESTINFEVRNSTNPKSLFYSSYIYLKKGYYKFNFDIDISSHDDLFVKSKIIIYDNKEKTNYISVFKDNMVTKKWVYIPSTNYYIFDISLVYISGSSYNIPFKIKARYTNEEKSNKLEFSNAELNIDNYETISNANKFKDMSYYIYYHDNDYLSGIKDVTNQYNKDFNSFLESYYLLNDSFGYVINYFKLLGKTNNEIKSDTNIQKIDALIEYLTNVDLRMYLDSSGESKLKENNIINNIFAKNTINNINDYITFNQYRQEDKDNLKGSDDKFNIISHGPRSLYIELF